MAVRRGLQNVVSTVTAGHPAPYPSDVLGPLLRLPERGLQPEELPLRLHLLPPQLLLLLHRRPLGALQLLQLRLVLLPHALHPEDRETGGRWGGGGALKPLQQRSSLRSHDLRRARGAVQTVKPDEANV